LHGGSLTVESPLQSPIKSQTGGGAEFMVKLPIV